MNGKVQISADVMRGIIINQHSEARELIRELLSQLLPSVKSQMRYSQGVQSALLRAKVLLDAMDRLP